MLRPTLFNNIWVRTGVFSNSRKNISCVSPLDEADCTVTISKRAFSKSRWIFIERSRWTRGESVERRGFYPAQRRRKQWGGRWYHHHVCFVITVESMHLTAHIGVGPTKPLHLFWRILATISFFQQCLSVILETVTIETLFKLVADHTLPHPQPQPSPHSKNHIPFQLSLN